MGEDGGVTTTLARQRNKVAPQSLPVTVTPSVAVAKARPYVVDGAREVILQHLGQLVVAVGV